MRRWLLFPAALLVFPLLSHTLHAQTGTLSGKVVDSVGAPLYRVMVRILGTTRGCYTKVDGTFKVENIPVGDYEVKMTSIAKKDFIQNVRITSDQAVDMGTITLENNERRAEPCLPLSPKTQSHATLPPQ